MPSVGEMEARAFINERYGNKPQSLNQPLNTQPQPQYKAVDMSPVYSAIGSRPQQVFDLNQLKTAIDNAKTAGGGPIQVRQTQYQTPEGISNLINQMVDRMQPLTQAQESGATNAFGQALQNLRNQWASRGLLASGAAATKEAEAANNLAGQIAQIRAQAQANAIPLAFNAADLGLREDAQHFGQQESNRNFDFNRAQQNVSNLGSALGIQETQLQNFIRNLMGAKQMEVGQNQFDANFGLQSNQQAFNQGMATRQQNFNEGMANKDFALKEGQLTGSYLPDEARNLVQQILANKQAYGGATPAEQQRISQSNQDMYRQLDLMGVNSGLINGDVPLEQALQNLRNMGIRTLPAQQQQFNQGIQLAELTGRLPDGTPTNAYQQQQLANLWKTADTVGYVTPELSKMTGIPAGTPTLQAKQIAIAQRNADTAASKAFMSSTKTSATQSKNDRFAYAVNVLDGRSPADRKQILENEKSNFIRDFGVDGYNQLKNMYLDKDGAPLDVPVKQSTGAISGDIGNAIVNTAQRYGVSPNLALAVANAESGATANGPDSPAGAIGVFQLMPGTAQGLGVNPRDPMQNIDGGVRYLKQMLDMFGGDTVKALAAYNQGPGAVQSALQQYGEGFLSHAPAETQNYVRKILSGIEVS